MNEDNGEPGAGLMVMHAKAVFEFDKLADGECGRRGLAHAATSVLRGPLS
jgi:hypothetical protein